MNRDYDILLNSIIAQDTAGDRYPGRKFLPVCYLYERCLPLFAQSVSYLRLIGGGRVDATMMFDLSIPSVGMPFLLSSIQGEGELTFGNEVKRIEDNTILIFGSRASSCHLRPIVLPWSFRLFFPEGPGLEDFLSLLPQYRAMAEADVPLVTAAIEELSLLPADVGPASLLRMHRLLTDIFTEVCLPLLPQINMHEDTLPAWLHDLHVYIHDCGNLTFSLAHLESLYGINRYRLCREYTAAFGISPLKDFNHVRMLEAKKMLLNTNLQVQEISNILGYENINHFIHLFKAETGVTPGAFRQQHKA